MRMERPSIKPAYRPIRRPDGTIWVGGGPVGAGCEIKDEPAAVWRLCQLADGSRRPEEIVDALCQETGLDKQHAVRLLDALIARGWVEDLSAPAGELSLREIDRYSHSRQFWSWVDTEARSTPYELQERLKWARVSVVGVGGIGSAVAAGLVASGVGAVTCTDFDAVQLSNLNRQMLYAESDIGRLKVTAAVARLRSLNSDVQVDGFDRRIGGPADLSEVVDGADLFVLCARRPAEIVFWANTVALAAGIPWINCCYAGPMLSVGTFIPGKTGCFVCMRIAEEARMGALGLTDMISEVGPAPFSAVIAPTAQIAGYYATLEALHLLLGRPAQTAGRVLHKNYLAYDHTYFIEAPRDPGCGACGEGGS